MGIESYIGAPIIEPDGRLLGLLVLLDTQPMPERETVSAIIEFLAARIALEFQREERECSARQQLWQNLHRENLQMLGQLAGGIAHDVNNLLSGILGHLELVQKKLETDHPARRHVDLISTTAEQAKGIARVDSRNSCRLSSRYSCRVLPPAA
jgi:signal transduction histidine kinase